MKKEIVSLMPAAPELVLSDLRGPMNATQSRFDVIIVCAAAGRDTDSVASCQPQPQLMTNALLCVSVCCSNKGQGVTPSKRTVVLF
jgi:hypothetical protein